MTVKQIIETLGLVPLVREGGMYLRTYESGLSVNGQPVGTAIYYFLSGDDFSHLHRLSGDEVYHFYLGDPVELVELLPDGLSKTTILGPDILSGQCVQHLVPAGNWQGSQLVKGGSFALLGTTMCPGYTDSMYENGDAEALLAKYPEAREKILQLTR